MTSRVAVALVAVLFLGSLALAEESVTEPPVTEPPVQEQPVVEAPAEVEDVTFTLTNTSAQSVTGFYATVPGETELALLGGALSTGTAQEVTIPAGKAACVRNLRIVFADETVQERGDVDLCNMDGYIIE